MLHQGIKTPLCFPKGSVWRRKTQREYTKSVRRKGLKLCRPRSFSFISLEEVVEHCIHTYHFLWGCHGDCGGQASRSSHPISFFEPSVDHHKGCSPETSVDHADSSRLETGTNTTAVPQSAVLTPLIAAALDAVLSAKMSS
ncbi:unnamed protein product [Gadus morhua 'NCC']